MLSETCAWRSELLADLPATGMHAREASGRLEDLEGNDDAAHVLGILTDRLGLGRLRGCAAATV
jgi:hypothetical protein